MNQNWVRQPLWHMAIGGRIIGITPIPTVSPARSRRIVCSLIVLMAAMVASLNPLPQRQSQGCPRSPKLTVRSKPMVQHILFVLQMLGPGPCNGGEIASQNCLSQWQSGRPPGCPKVPVCSEPTLQPKLAAR